jgi:hypothetical protein
MTRSRARGAGGRVQAMGGKQVHGVDTCSFASVAAVCKVDVDHEQTAA